MTPDESKKQIASILGWYMWYHWDAARRIPNLAENTAQSHARTLEAAEAIGIKADVLDYYQMIGGGKP